MGNTSGLISHLRVIHVATYNAYEKINDENRILHKIEIENNFDSSDPEDLYEYQNTDITTCVY